MLQDGNQIAKQQWVQQNAYNKKGNLRKVVRERERERERERTLLCPYFHHKTSNVNAGLLLNRLLL